MNEQTDLIQYTKKRSLCRRLLPLLLAMGLLLVGCSGGTEPSEPSSDTGSPQRPPAARLPLRRRSRNLSRKRWSRSF